MSDANNTEPADKPNVCGDCFYCREGPNTHADVLSRVCYRNPPTALAFLTQKGIVMVSARPEIRVDTFACGEYDPEEGGDSLQDNQSSGLTS